METTNKIETLVKLLGTMVMKPQFESNPQEIGSKPVFAGSVQMPIINDEKDRKVIEDKVLELVKSL